MASNKILKPVRKEDGSVSRNPDKSKTVAAIISFQKNVVKLIRPDYLMR